MKNLLPWIKNNWMIIVLALIAVAALPSLWFVSSGMKAKTIDEFQKKVQRDFTDVTASKLSYKVVSPTGTSLLETTAPANPARIAAFKTIGEQLAAQTGVVSKAADALNTNNGEHKPLIEGLFPAPSELEKLSKPKEFARAILRNERPRLLKSINAGMPPPAEDLAAQLNQIVVDKREQVRNEQGRTELDAQEVEQLGKDLLNARLGAYQSRSSNIQVYADESIFDEIPAEYIDSPAPLALAWDWQEQLWIHEDLLRAVAASNGDSGRRGVSGSVVKRITRLGVDPAPFTPAQGGSSPSDGAPFEPGADRAPLDLSRSVTGRISGPGSNNRWYDVRYVTMEIVADAQRLPVFIDALASTNFMTVIDADLVKIEPGADIRAGFYYGESPVVKATLTIETVWFREWRQPWMPLEVKRALAMDESAPAAAAAAPAAPSRSRGPRAAPPRDGVPGDAGGAGGRRGRGGGDD